jgi:hypothetical protein
MKNITMANTTLITGVLFASPQGTDRGRVADAGGAFYAPTRKTAVKDVAYPRSGRPSV